MSEKVTQIDRWLRGLSPTWLLVDTQKTPASWLLEHVGKRLFVSLNSHWLSLTLPLAEACSAPNRYHDYLQLCHLFFLCKLSLGTSGELYLQVELPSATLECTDVYKGIEALCVYEARFFKGEKAELQPLPAQRVDATAGFHRETLLLYFKTIEYLGWGLRDDIGNGHWKAIYKGYDRPFDVYLSLDASWVYFQTVIMSPASRATSDTPHANFLHTYLLQLNESIHWLKFGLDQDQQILMMVEIPRRGFTLEQFQFATRAIAAYANQLAYDIQIVANLRKEERICTFLALVS